MYYFKCEQNLWTNSIWTYIITTLWMNQWGIFAKEFTSKVHSSHSKWPVCTFVFLQIFLAIRLIRELILSCCKLLLNCWVTIAKLLNQSFFWVPKLPVTAIGCYDTNARLFTYLNNRLFLHESKIWNYDGLCVNKKIPDENQRFDWIKSIHGYRLLNIGWFADINLFNHNP